MGRANEPVLPDPVSASPMMSRPACICSEELIKVRTNLVLLVTLKGQGECFSLYVGRDRPFESLTGLTQNISQTLSVGT